MPMKKGHSPDVVRSNIKEMVSAGYEPKQAIAASLSSARKYKKMSEGGMYSEGGDVHEEHRSLGELQDIAVDEPDDIANPELQDEKRMLAAALAKDAEETEYMSEGGLVEGMDGDEMPDEDMASDTDEPMSSMPSKPASMEYEMSGLSEMAKMALEAKKKKRRFS